MFLNEWIQGERFDGFCNQISNDINGVFRERFIRGKKKEGLGV
jgi:hypothetical protein